jgi:hypothetical protein
LVSVMVAGSDSVVMPGILEIGIIRKEVFSD